MLTLLGKLKFYLILIAVIVAGALYIKHLLQQNAELRMSAEILAKSYKQERERNERLNELIKESEEKRLQREKELEQQAETIKMLARKSKQVRKALSTRLPAGIIKFLRDNYGKGRKRETTGLLRDTNTRTGVARVHRWRLTKLYKPAR